MNKRTTTPRVLALLLALATALAVFTGCGGTPTSQASGTGAKSVTLTVVHKDGTSKDFSMKTDAENLREALEEQNLIAGDESEYGLFVKTVDGETVDPDESKEEWWRLTDKDGNMTPTGVDSTKISDGDAYTFTFMVGYDE